MQLIIAECSAIYTGRGDSKLDRGVRAIFIKDDGSVSIHNENSNKPLNYMKTASKNKMRNEAGEDVWVFDNKHESLEITLHSIEGMFQHGLITKEEEPGLIKDGTEHQLQAWLFDNPETIGFGYRSIEREFNTSNGSVDLLLLAPTGEPVIVEVKRVATQAAADQLRRYHEASLELAPRTMTVHGTSETVLVDFSKTIGVIAALDMRPKLLPVADKRDYKLVVVPKFWRDTASDTEE